MSKVGELIKSKRERAGMSIADVAKITAIRAHILEALEKGEFSSMPSYVHAYGFLEQYCKAVGINFHEDAKTLFNEECNKEHFGKSPEEVAIEQTIQPCAPKMPMKMKAFVIVGLILLSVAAFAVYDMYNSTLADSVGKNVATSNIGGDNVNTPSPNEEVERQQPQASAETAVVAQPSDSVGFLQELDEPLASTPPAINKAGIHFKEECWFRVQIDLDEEVEYTAPKGHVYEVEFKNSFNVFFGNAAAGTVKYKGQVFDNFGRDGVPSRNNVFKVENGVMSYSRVRQ